MTNILVFIHCQPFVLIKIPKQHKTTNSTINETFPVTNRCIVFIPSNGLLFINNMNK